MRILIYDVFFHIVNGASKYILFLADFLSENNEITLLGDKQFSYGFLKKFYGVELKNVKIEFLNLKEYKGPGKRLISNWEHIKRCNKVSWVSGDYDIFINNVGGHYFQIRPQSKKSIMMVHFLMNPFHSFVYPERFKKIKNIARKILLPNPKEYNFVSSYNLVICNSDFTKRWIKEWFKREDAKIINPPVCLPDNYHSRKENIILSVGRFAPLGPEGDGKGRDSMIEAFKILYNQGIKNYSLILAGGIIPEQGTQRYIGKLKKMVRGYPVKFYFDLEQTELSRIYSQAKIFWHLMGLEVDEQKHPERLEPFGMVTAEAMSYGAVPVVTSAGGQREIVENNKSGFLINNLKELIERTEYLCEETSNWEAFSQQAKERSNIFSRDKFFKQWQEVLVG